MRYITLSDFHKIPDTQIYNFPDAEEANNNIRGISIDSRSIKSGEVFWAIKGERFDGHNYVANALQNGAAGIVIQRNFMTKFRELDIPVIVVNDTLDALQTFASMHRKKYKIPVLGITGTNGKTTIKEMIAWILQKKFNVLKTYGNMNNLIGTPLTLFNLNSDHQIAIIELGTNQPGEIDKLVSIVQPTAALITNIGRGHLQNFSSIEGLAHEKIRLFKSISRRGIIFLNRDDTRLPKYPFRRKTLWSYSLEGKRKARVSGMFVELDNDGMGVWKLNDKVTITMKIPGKHHVQNALAAGTVALYYGLKEEEIKEALENYTSFDKRMQIVKSGGVVIINDSYNANPDSFTAALQTFNHIASNKNGRKIIVLGDMLELGLESESYHHDLLFSLLEYDVDGIFALGKESRLAARDLKEKGFNNVFWFSTHENLAKELKLFIKKGDYLLLKGSRGMQMEKVLGLL